MLAERSDIEIPPFFYDMLNSKKNDMVALSCHAFGIIVAKRPNAPIPPELYKALTRSRPIDVEDETDVNRLLTPGFDNVNIVAFAALCNILEARSYLSIPSEFYTALTDTNSTIRSIACKAFSIRLTSYADSLDPELHKDFIHCLIDADAGVSLNAFRGLKHHIISLHPKCISTILYSHSFKPYHKFIGLLQYTLTKLGVHTQISFYRILNLLSFHDSKEPEKRDLLDVARSVLSLKISKITQNDLSELTEHYEEILAVSLESKAAFTKILHQVLKQALNKTSISFISLCLSHGFSMSFCDDRSVIFCGNTYGITYKESDELTQDVNNLIWQTLNLPTMDSLALLHKKPLFISYTSYLKAPDQNALSLSHTSLTHEKFLVSICALSNHQQSVPTQVFLLCERLDYFGKVQIIKRSLFGQHTNFEEFHFTQTINTVRTSVFTQMHYSDSKPRYFIHTFTCEDILHFKKITVQQSLIDLFSTLSQHTDITSWEDFLTKSQEHKIYDLLDLSADEAADARRKSLVIEDHYHIVNLQFDLKSLSALIDPNALQEFYTQKIENEINKIGHEILALKKEQRTLKQQKQDTEALTRRIDDFEAKSTALEEKLNISLLDISKLAESFESSVARISKLETSFLDLDHITKDQKQYQKSLDAIHQQLFVHQQALENTLDDSSNIQKAIHDCQDQLIELQNDASAKALALEIIESKLIKFGKITQDMNQTYENPYSDPYQASLYDTVIRKLCSLYLATSVVQTDVLSSEKKGFVGTVGTIIGKIGSFVPIFGLAFDIVGSFITALDEQQQSMMLERFYSVASTSVMMENIARLCARNIVEAINNRTIDTAALDAPESLKEKMQTLLMEITEFDPVSAAAALTLKAFTSNKKLNAKNDNGQKHGEQLATFITMQIYVGKAEAGPDIANKLFELVLNEYGSTCQVIRDHANSKALSILDEAKKMLTNSYRSIPDRETLLVNCLTEVIAEPAFSTLNLTNFSQALIDDKIIKKSSKFSLFSSSRFEISSEHTRPFLLAWSRKQLISLQNLTQIEATPMQYSIHK